jgi:hypothetical protein
MSTDPEHGTEISPEEFLKDISAKLDSPDGPIRLAAIEELAAQKYSSQALLGKLEKLALDDPNKRVRAAASQALKSPTHRFIQKRNNTLKRTDRKFLLSYIEEWQKTNLLSQEQAEVISTRYNFDLEPVAPPPAPEPSPPSIPVPELKQTEPPAPKQPPAPRPSLTQTLLSETSIKIALYLGSFFVISAAAILAAIVEAARLPILFIATALFAGGALLTRKRLPQPSFALFIVFSFLLPTDAVVLGDVLNLTGNANSFYWFGVMAAMALLWSFGTWFYASRLFSLAAFVALALSVSRLAELFNAEPEIYLLLLALVSLAGLGGSRLLKRWKNTKFSTPLFILVQLVQLGLNMYALVVVLVRIEDFPSTWNLISAIFWLLTACFYALSDRIYPFVLFPWLAAGALYPVPMLFTFIFNTDAQPVAIASWTWGAALALASEAFPRIKIQSDILRRHTLPLLAVSIVVVISAILIGFVAGPTYGFAFFLSSAILYAVIQILKPRVYVWIPALLFGLGAFFSFFTLPFMEGITIFIGYKFLAASLLTLVPDLFLKADFSESKSWRWPLRILGAILVTLNFSLLLPLTSTDIGHAAVVYGVYTIFFAVYALRFNTSWIGYLATASAAFSLIQSLRYFDLDIWLPALTGLAAVYYLGGWTIKSRPGGWPGMLRISGLALTGLTSLAALFFPEKAYGWYLLVTGALFTFELFLRKNGWLEAGPAFFLPAAMVLLMQDFRLEPLSYYLLGLSLLWLTLDLVFERTFQGRRPFALPLRGLGALLVIGNSLYLLFDLDPVRAAWICFACYSIYFLIYALLRKLPALGCAFTSFLPLTIWYLLRDLNLDAWLLPMMIPAVLYYLIGFGLARREKLQPWSAVLRTSGLGLASLAALVGVITAQGNSGWFSLLASLLFVIEMYQFQMDKAEAGIQLFLAVGVFTLLGELRVFQDYQLLAISLALLGTDLVLANTYKRGRLIAWYSRAAGAIFIVFNSYNILQGDTPVNVGAICFGIYMLFLLTQALLYRIPALGYGTAFYAVLTVIKTLKAFGQDDWLLPVTALAIIFYGSGFFLRKRQRENRITDGSGLLFLKWPFVLWTSGLGAGLLATMVAPAHGGLSAAIPVAVTATMVAVEAFDRRNVWLGFPANALYLMAYFILLVELHQDEPQFFTIATAALGLLMHYLLTRAGSRTGAFITGMVSQLVLLSTTYIQFVSTGRLLFFAVLFFQALAVLVYGIVIRSRSLVITPIVFAVLSVGTALYGLLEGILPVILIGCTGIILLMAGILAVILRERIKQIGERFSDWGA